MRLLVTDRAAHAPRQATAWLIMTLDKKFMPETYAISLVRAGWYEPAEINIIEADSDRVRLVMRAGSLAAEAESDDCFSALQDIRRVLEKDGLAVYCYGSSRNVFPSGMSRSMGGGRKAYRLSLGKPGLIADLVDIFLIGPDIELASVCEQEEFFQEWITSLGKK